MIFGKIDFGRKILRIWMKAAGLVAFSLEAYLKKLKDFSPPRGGFDPEGAWEHTYDVYPVYGKLSKWSDKHEGKCRIKREVVDGGDSFRLDVSSEVTFLDLGYGKHPTRSQLTTARIRCKSDCLYWISTGLVLVSDARMTPEL
jgi:hypothetical protein